MFLTWQYDDKTHGVFYTKPNTSIFQEWVFYLNGADIILILHTVVTQIYFFNSENISEEHQSTQPCITIKNNDLVYVTPTKKIIIPITA